MDVPYVVKARFPRKDVFYAGNVIAAHDAPQSVLIKAAEQFLDRILPRGWEIIDINQGALFLVNGGAMNSQDDHAGAAS